MQTFEVLNPGNHARKSSSLTSVLLVGSLHVAAVYTLLVAFDMVPNPVAPRPPVTLQVIDQPKVIDHLPPIPPRGPILARPEQTNPVPPQIVIGNLPSGGTAITPNVGPGQPLPAQPTAGTALPLRPVSATHTIPPYPSIAIRLAHEGTARLRITVGEQGNVVSADVAQSSGHGELDAAAIAWVKEHWRYQPALKDGHAIASTTTAIVTFRLDQAH